MDFSERHCSVLVLQEDLLSGSVSVLWGPLQPYRSSGHEWGHHCPEAQCQHAGEGSGQNDGVRAGADASVQGQMVAVLGFACLMVLATT